MANDCRASGHGGGKSLVSLASRRRLPCISGWRMRARSFSGHAVCRSPTRRRMAPGERPGTVLPVSGPSGRIPAQARLGSSCGHRRHGAVGLTYQGIIGVRGRRSAVQAKPHVSEAVAGYSEALLAPVSDVGVVLRLCEIQNACADLIASDASNSMDSDAGDQQRDHLEGCANDYVASTALIVRRSSQTSSALRCCATAEALVPKVFNTSFPRISSKVLGAWLSKYVAFRINE